MKLSNWVKEYAKGNNLSKVFHAYKNNTKEKAEKELFSVLNKKITYNTVEQYDNQKKIGYNKIMKKTYHKEKEYIQHFNETNRFLPYDGTIENTEEFIKQIAYCKTEISLPSSIHIAQEFGTACLPAQVRLQSYLHKIPMNRYESYKITNVHKTFGFINTPGGIAEKMNEHFQKEIYEMAKNITAEQLVESIASNVSPIVLYAAPHMMNGANNLHYASVDWIGQMKSKKTGERITHVSLVNTYNNRRQMMPIDEFIQRTNCCEYTDFWLRKLLIQKFVAPGTAIIKRSLHN